MKSELIKYANGLNASSTVLEWIDKRIVNLINISEAEHIIDYLISDKAPKRLERATYKQMKCNAKKWADSLAKKGSNIKETDTDIKTILDFNDGFKIVQLIGEDAFKREGFLMRHCVASYFGKETKIYSLRDNQNMPHCTIEHNSQIKGKGNGNIHPEYIDYIVQFLELTGMKVRDYEMINLGYIVPKFLQFVENKLYRNRYLRKNDEIRYSDDVIIFHSLVEAVKYDGNKICLYSGSADFCGSQIKDLGKLQSIGGDADFRYSRVKDLGKLQSIGGSANFRDGQVKDLGKLQSIGGSANFRDGQVKDLGKLQSIGGNADFRGGQVKDLGKLQSIGGDADFRYSRVKDLGKLQSIGGDADFCGSRVKDLGNLQSIGGSADFRYSRVKDLGKLQSIGGDADFCGSRVKDLGNLQSIGGSADFRDGQVKDLGKLQSIGGNAYFRDSQVKDLGKLQSIGGNAYIAELKLEGKFMPKTKTNLGKILKALTRFRGSVKQSCQETNIKPQAFYSQFNTKGVERYYCQCCNQFVAREKREIIREQRNKEEDNAKS